MNKTVIVTILATLLLIVAGVLLLGNKQNSSSTPPPPPTSYEYFWAEGCPHCENVADFMESWEKNDQVKIDKFEVWNNTKNASLFETRYRSCNITNPAEMGVPLLFTPEGKCFSGDQPIIDYFKNLQ